MLKSLKRDYDKIVDYLMKKDWDISWSYDYMWFKYGLAISFSEEWGFINVRCNCQKMIIRTIDELDQFLTKCLEEHILRTI